MIYGNRHRGVQQQPTAALRRNRPRAARQQQTSRHEGRQPAMPIKTHTLRSFRQFSGNPRLRAAEPFCPRLCSFFLYYRNAASASQSAFSVPVRHPSSTTRQSCNFSRHFLQMFPFVFVHNGALSENNNRIVTNIATPGRICYTSV